VELELGGVFPSGSDSSRKLRVQGTPAAD